MHRGSTFFIQNYITKAVFLMTQGNRFFCTIKHQFIAQLFQGKQLSFHSTYESIKSECHIQVNSSDW